MNSPKPTHTQNSHTNSDQTKNDRTIALLGVYQELSKSHQSIDDFRMKLLGLLPLASLTGIFFVSKSDSFFGSSDPALEVRANNLIAFIAIFAATFTLALFLYEIRGILMCSELIYRGCKIENDLDVIGQF